MKIIACLGNPGKKYYYNRHNIGFLVAEYLAKERNNIIQKKEFKGLTTKINLAGKDVLLLLPQTFMNLSGESVIAALNFYNHNENDLVVIHDELELPFGDIRVKISGGHKGHNGIRSIINTIGTPDFARVRFGIGRPTNEHISVADYVLADFIADEKEKLDSCYKITEDLLIKIIQGE